MKIPNKLYVKQVKHRQVLKYIKATLTFEKHSLPNLAVYYVLQEEETISQ